MKSQDVINLRKQGLKIGQIAKVLGLKTEYVYKTLLPVLDSLQLYIDEVERFIIQDKSYLFLDVGSYDMKESIQLSSRFKNCSFVVFEPHPENFRICKEKAKDLANVKVVNKAVTANDGVTSFYCIEGNSAASSVLTPIDVPYSFNKFKTISVESVRLSTFLRKAVLKPDFLWIDVQGAELSVLEGLGEEYINDVKVIHLEAAQKGYYKNHALQSDIHMFLESRGFQIKHIIEHTGHPYGECDYIYSRP